MIANSLKPTISELPQGNVALDDGHVVSGVKQHVQRSTDTETSTHVSAQVRRFFNLYTPLLSDYLLDIGYVSVFCR